MATRLPRQIQAQLDAADQLLAPQPPAEPTAPVQPELVPPQPEPVNVEAPVPPPPAPAPATPPSENWEHKYRVLQGMFNQRDAQLKQALQKLDEVAARLQQPAPPTPAPTAAPKPVADPKDVDAFGLDMVQMVQRVTSEMFAHAEQVMETRFARIEQSISQLTGKVDGTTQTVQATAEDLFFSKLTELCPDWVRLNEDPSYLAWLQLVDPMYGLPRDAALQDAFRKGDAQRAAKVFNTYIETLPPPPAPAPSPSPTPRSAGTPAPAGAPPKAGFTTAEVEAFYADVRRGKYRGREQEYQRLNDQINAALAEGRIR